MCSSFHGFLNNKNQWIRAFLQLLIFSLFLFPCRTDFEFLQEIPILTLDVNEDFKGKKDRYDHMTEKVKKYCE